MTKLAAFDANDAAWKMVPIVGLQHFQPGAEIVGVADGRGDAQFGAQECRAQLGDQFFTGVSLPSPFSGEIPVQTRRMPRPVSQFMQLGAKPVDRLEIGFLRRNLDEVVRWRIERHVAADPDVGARGGDNGLDVGKRFSSSWQQRGVRISGKPITLLGMEDGEALEEADTASFVSRCCNFLQLCLGNEGVGIDDHGPFLSLAYGAAKCQRLLEG